MRLEFGIEMKPFMAHGRKHKLDLEDSKGNGCLDNLQPLRLAERYYVVLH